MNTPQNSLPAAPPYGLSAGDTPKKVSVQTFADMRARGEKIAMLTAYDATFAAVADAAGVDTLLVGDSLGMVCQGGNGTVGVSLDDMVYHTQCVAEGVRRTGGRALIVADLPFGSYQVSKEQAIVSAMALMSAGAQMVKLEGGGWVADTARFLVERGVPVCGHLGLTPQTVSSLGGFRVQGRTDEGAARLREDSAALEAAGATMLVLEMVPAALAAAITADLPACATIGIGAGRGTAGQVLVMHDMLGVNLGRMAKFVRNFMEGSDGVKAAMESYVRAVKDGSFPDDAKHAW
ncbi:3-methyl-2-oxobutanoate hydroxymethyltransferase [Achromobacter marplatensis]|uniref:3-methyl-2-oxobutanoate hydroxymethyltransferase n=1 Tax=Achromobacter marplatensis TaxID=470868 RepID=UPI0039F6E2EF